MNNFAGTGGIWPALLTPVAKDGSPDLDELVKLVDVCMKQKLDGLYILGSTGQGFLFSEKQRSEITRTVVETVAGTIPVIAQVGALNTQESVRLAKDAQRLGVYGVSTVAPIYYPTGGGKALEHYRLIASAIEIPFFPYHIGNTSIFGNDAQAYIEQILGLPNIRGMKLTTQNLYEISLIGILSEGRLDLYSGADELFCQASLCGTIGAIGSFYNVWGEECRYVRAGFIKGDFELGNRFMKVFQEVIHKVLPNVWTFLQSAMRMKYGIELGIPNPPLGLCQAAWDENEVAVLLDKVSKAAGG